MERKVIMDRLKSDYDMLVEMGYEVAYVCLYGSQNYNLSINTDSYKSDIDTKAVLIPTLKELVHQSKPVSKVFECENGQCDAKDIRNFVDNGLCKANPAYIETLYTDYYIINSKYKEQMESILSLRDELVDCLKFQMFSAMYGMALEKKKALSHPYPSIVEKIEKYGYDGKQLSHAYRLYIMAGDFYFEGKPLKECFMPKGEYRDRIMEYKLNKPSLDEANEIMNATVGGLKGKREILFRDFDKSKIDYSVKQKVIDLSREIIIEKIKNDIIKGEK